MSLDTTIRNTVVMQQYDSTLINYDGFRYEKNGAKSALAVSNGKLEIINKENGWQQFLIRIGYKSIINIDELDANPIIKEVKEIKESDLRVAILSSVQLDEMDSTAHKIATANLSAIREHELKSKEEPGKFELAIRGRELRLVDTTTIWNQIILGINWISLDENRIKVLKDIVSVGRDEDTSFKKMAGKIENISKENQEKEFGLSFGPISHTYIMVTPEGSQYFENLKIENDRLKKENAELRQHQTIQLSTERDEH